MWLIAATVPQFWFMVPVFIAPLVWFGYKYVITMKFIRKNRETLAMLDREIKKGTFDND